MIKPEMDQHVGVVANGTLPSLAPSFVKVGQHCCSIHVYCRFDERCDDVHCGAAVGQALVRSQHRHVDNVNHLKVKLHARELRVLEKEHHKSRKFINESIK